ncbi:MAG: 30S ribosomal protein S3 [Eubacteriales bacterium]|nr:30S ribosomal protein S3 [Eubacteriales bacterium]
MGQKVSPHGFRVGVIDDWNTKWFASKDNFADFLAEDDAIRKVIKKSYYNAGISKIVIERPEETKVVVRVATARPGLIIGKDGADINLMTKKLEKLTNGKKVQISIEEVRRADMDAQVSAESIADALEKRTSFRRAMKQQITRTMKAGAKGCKVVCSGRLGGAEIARKEQYSEGNVPLHTLRADIDYGFAEANTTYGKIGVKVWINHGEYLDKALLAAIREEKREERRGRGRRNGRRDDRRRGNDRRRGGDRRNGGRQEMAKTAYGRKRVVKEAPAEEVKPEATEAE